MIGRVRRKIICRVTNSTNEWVTNTASSLYIYVSPLFLSLLSHELYTLMRNELWVYFFRPPLFCHVWVRLSHELNEWMSHERCVSFISSSPHYLSLKSHELKNEWVTNSTNEWVTNTTSPSSFVFPSSFCHLWVTKSTSEWVTNSESASCLPPLFPPFFTRHHSVWGQEPLLIIVHSIFFFYFFFLSYFPKDIVAYEAQNYS